MKVSDLSWPAVQPEYDDDLLLNIRAGTIVLLIRGRNAWHNTWVRHYLRNATLYSDVPSAKRGAEGQRGRGNVFYIVEAPALLLSGQASRVVLCDAHPDNPFGEFRGFNSSPTQSIHGAWIDGIFPGVSVRDAVAAFHHRSGHWAEPLPGEHSLRTGRLDSADPFDARAGSMRSLVSRAIGTDYLLQWDADSPGNRYSRRGAAAVAKQWTEITGDVLKGQTQSESQTKRLQQYRLEVLDALPKSQWTVKKELAEAEERARRREALLKWTDALDQVRELKARLHRAALERDAANEARMRPASTSAGVRKQRERVESATAEFMRLTGELERAEANAEALRRQYRGW